ncbi:MAG: hypothetical protein EZS28_000255 [Streblomastix strix]|uniref:C2HC/C3H-type domain-containing protein n=1 Tax=Streblomastix strix TaxID=222440 RepID=A0A5J4XA68_9EUKA|nr:MAG: hypothetical protein EZS28_000255 [Streblomastix strix]
MESDDEETTLLDNQNQIKSRFGGISSIELIPCSYCNRKFRRERIAVHQEICKNNAQREKERKENELALRRKNWSPQRKPLQSQPTIDEGDQFFSSSLRREYEPSPQRVQRSLSSTRAPSVGTRDLQEKGKSIFADDLQDLSGSRRIRRKKKSGQSDSTTRSLRSLDESSYDESFDPLDNTQDEQLDELMNVEEEDEEEGSKTSSSTGATSCITFRLTETW